MALGIAESNLNRWLTRAQRQPEDKVWDPDSACPQLLLYFLGWAVLVSPSFLPRPYPPSLTVEIPL